MASPESATLAVTIIPVGPAVGVKTPGQLVVTDLLEFEGACRVSLSDDARGPT